MNETTLTITGNLAADPELRFTQSGAAVANFTVISTPRRYDRTTGQWSDGEPISIRCNLWRAPAENAAESLKRGSRVIVTGRLRSRQWETRDGDKRISLELEVDDIGASLKFATVAISKAARSSVDTSVSSNTGNPTDGGQFDDEPPF
ncbi:MAG: single-stranded DNA-binding protein [Pseudonocardiales bacterium]|nr:single-stranded DNA-binding protein [Pseudonocardiales bacterium]